MQTFEYMGIEGKRFKMYNKEGEREGRKSNQSSVDYSSNLQIKGTLRYIIFKTCQAA